MKVLNALHALLILTLFLILQEDMEL